MKKNVLIAGVAVVAIVVAGLSFNSRQQPSTVDTPAEDEQVIFQAQAATWYACYVSVRNGSEYVYEGYHYDSQSDNTGEYEEDGKKYKESCDELMPALERKMKMYKTTDRTLN